MTGSGHGFAPAAPALLAVPNVSEGRDADAIQRLADAAGHNAALLDTHSDPAHNRTVFTLAADEPARVLAALAAEAALAIDMTDQRGEHPRIGALDVAPVVYLEPGTRDQARRHAIRAGEAIAELSIPVFLYGDLAASEERRERAHFRRGGFEELRERMRDGELQPDLGPREAHPTAGATLVTARAPLAAFNVELAGASLAATREIAAALRESGGGLPGVRAIGLELRPGVTQVSTNVHDPVAVPLREVVAAVRDLAAPYGGEVVAAEIVGLVPRAALDGFPPDVPVPGFDSAHGVIEERLRRLAE